MSHYLLPGGDFERASHALLATGGGVPWQSSLPDVSRPQDGDGPAVPCGRSKTFTCPQCTQKAWAKPTASLLCKVCRRRMGAEKEVRTQSVL